MILFGSKVRVEPDGDSDIEQLVVTLRALSRGERPAVTDAISPLQLRHDVVLSVPILAVHESDSGIVSVLPIHEEITERCVTE